MAAPDAPVARVDVAAVTPEEFARDFVAARRPCVLHGHLPDASFGEWTTEWLRSLAGDQAVEVEHREPGGRFGQGRLRKMAFGAFLDSIEAGDTSLYMTTQDLKATAAGKPALMAPPVTQLALAHAFPLRPALLPALVPAVYNLWIGNSRDGTSSGLHHDFHDNLYVLLKGKKSFRLYSPADAAHMYTSKPIALVHPNGRICYEVSSRSATHGLPPGPFLSLRRPPPPPPFFSKKFSFIILLFLGPADAGGWGGRAVRGG